MVIIFAFFFIFKYKIVHFFHNNPKKWGQDAKSRLLFLWNFNLFL